MSAVLIADLHLTDRKQDEYRWKIFDQVDTLISKHNLEYVFVLGDVTDKKDNHSAELVNRITDQFEMLATNPLIRSVHIIPGNHDSIDPQNPFLKFMRMHPKIEFHDTPTTHLYSDEQAILMLPYDPAPSWNWRQLDFTMFDLIFCHQCFDGVTSQNNHVLSGTPTEVFKGFTGDVYAGDIHKPQEIGPVEYVGAPYHIDFGDDYQGRCLILDKHGKTKPVLLDNIRKLTLNVDSADEIDAREGDQVKIRLRLPRSEFVEWARHRQKIVDRCNELGVELFGIELMEIESDEPTKEKKPQTKKEAQVKAETPKTTFERYCDKEGIEGRIREIGMELVK